MIEIKGEKINVCPNGNFLQKFLNAILILSGDRFRGTKCLQEAVVRRCSLK